jgi:acyl-CoA 6-desaturase (Delta-6 desaturase)
MGKGSNSTILSSSPSTSSNIDKNDNKKPVYTWNEVKKHNIKGDCWIVINDNVYNVSEFKLVHPGGSRIISHYSGQDATVNKLLIQFFSLIKLNFFLIKKEVFTAFHKDFEKVNHFRRQCHIGRIDKSTSEEQQYNLSDAAEKRKNDIKQDFRHLRKIATDMKLFEPSYFFFFMQALQICFFHYMGYYLIWHSNGHLLPITIALIFQIIAQGQSDWTEHDYGHSSLFPNPKYNRIAQQFFLGTVKGASASWWNFMHNQHHAKPNVMGKDPDVRIDPLFVLGKLEPVQVTFIYSNLMQLYLV